MENKRQLQAASLIKQEISMVFLAEGSYIYGDALVTVTKVSVSPDLGLARIYLSVYNTNTKEAVVEAVIHHLDKLRQTLAKRIRKRIRRIPVLEFYQDDTLDEMYRLNKLFDKIQSDSPSQSSEKTETEENE